MDLIIKVLLEQGSSSRVEIEKALGEGHNSSIRGILSRMHRSSVREPKRVYICGWIRDVPGEARYLRPVYELGSHKDVPKPPALSSSEREKIRRDDGKVRVPSVFDLGTPIRQRLAKDFRRNIPRSAGVEQSADPGGLVPENRVLDLPE